MPTRTLMSNPNRALYPLAERVDCADDVESGVNRPMRVVLVSLGMAEHRQQPVALRGPDVAFVAFDDLVYLVAIPPDHGAVDLGLDSGRQCRRIDKIGEEDCQAPDLTAVSGGSEQLLGVGIAAVDREYLPGERVGRLPVAQVDRSNGAIKQFVARGLAHRCVHSPIVTGVSREICCVGPVVSRVSCAEVP